MENNADETTDVTPLTEDEARCPDCGCEVKILSSFFQQNRKATGSAPARCIDGDCGWNGKVEYQIVRLISSFQND